MAWQRLGSTTLVGTDTNISTGVIIAKTNLVSLDNPSNQDGVASGTDETFNNDVGANYSLRKSINGATDTEQDTLNQIGSGFGAGGVHFMVAYIIDISSEEKLGIQTHTGNDSPLGAGTIPYRIQSVYKWANTVDQITEHNISSTGSGVWQIGTNTTMLGTD